MCGQILGKKDDVESFCRDNVINSQTDMGNIFQNIVAVTTVPSTPTPHVDDGGDLMLEATSTDNVAVILLTMVALIMLLMMLAEYVDPSEILRSSKHHMVIIEG